MDDDEEAVKRPIPWVANAPCSFGAFELVEGDGPTGAALLTAVAEAGYAGIDLGPVGLLGSKDNIAEHLANHNLGLAGGWIQLPFAGEDVKTSVAVLDEILDIFDAARDAVGGAPPPVPTLADAGAPQRRGMAPGMAAADHSLGLDDAGWHRLCAGVNWAVSRCRERGYEPGFHPHVATWVEAPWEIDRLLDGTDASLCLDPGHLVTGGGDVLDVLSRWGDRISQVHVKDVRSDVVRAVREEGGDAFEVWKREAFTRLGEGNVDITALVDWLRNLGYRGWLVVEQDVLPVRPGYLERAIADQVHNREVLRVLGV